MARTRRGRQRNIVTSRVLADEVEAVAVDGAASAPAAATTDTPVHRRRIRARKSTSTRRSGDLPAVPPALTASEPRRQRRRARRAITSELGLPPASSPLEDSSAVDASSGLAEAPSAPFADRFADAYAAAAPEVDAALDHEVAPPDGAPTSAAQPLAASTVEPAADTTLLDRLRVALDNSTTTTSQADFTLRSIGQELRALTQRQSSFESRAVLNSVFAYVIFCALIFGALYFVFDIRSSKNAVDERYYESELQRQAERLTLLEAELEKYRLGSHHAFEVYQLIEQARHDEALARYIAVRDRVINPAEAAMLEARIGAVRWKLAESAYRQGLDFYGRDNLEQARDAFFHSLSYQTDTPYAHLLNYHLGRTLFSLGDFQGARHYFELALSKDLPRDLEAEARYHYAVATENIGLASDAFELYDAYLKRFRSFTEHADDVHKRMGRIERAIQRDRLAAQRAARERAQQQKEAEGQSGSSSP